MLKEANCKIPPEYLKFGFNTSSDRAKKLLMYLSAYSTKLKLGIYNQTKDSNFWRLWGIFAIRNFLFFSCCLFQYSFKELGTLSTVKKVTRDQKTKRKGLVWRILWSGPFSETGTMERRGREMGWWHWPSWIKPWVVHQLTESNSWYPLPLLTKHRYTGPSTTTQLLYKTSLLECLQLLWFICPLISTELLSQQLLDN